ncbi:HAMP domain-containing sensor histidine kinase [Streptantibioticus ferralitis]|uniref:histidine kinase n=1 Tax=Streptantibioticus ferralitis TaxID=236510 RepID=A0ABT5YT06_9ACTN|nr:HAMP domain-containing sensor histidine kinase [Streptantibioticus ferralitis]MDF2254741.1 HAMP domain-containing sensor histidine kinase [Streptantibioticus ferralitis]
MSLRNRVALAGGAVVLAVLLLASLVIYPVLGAQLTSQHDAALVAAANQAPKLLGAFATGKTAVEGGRAAVPTSPLPAAGVGTAVPAIPAKVIQVGGTSLQFLLPPVSVGPTDGFLAVSQTDTEVADGRHAAYFSDAAYDGVRYRVYTAPLAQYAGVVVRAAVPESEVGDTLRQLRILLAGIVVGGMLLAAAGARLAAGRVLGPVRRLTESVEHVTATGDLSTVVEARGRDEIARLAGAFATMMSALDDSVTTQRRLVADASHELRTPLTSLTTNLELLADGAGLADPEAPVLVSDARRQAGELAGLVNDLVDLARYGQARLHTQDARLDLLAEQVVERATRRTARVEFRTELEECLVHVDPDAVERAIGNLVDNAVKWSPAGGRVVVRVESRGTVSVADEGPGIPEADLPYVFDRFYRSPAARAMPGSGLGLSIVRQIAESHGGTVTAEPLAPGVRLRIALPAMT